MTCFNGSTGRMAMHGIDTSTVRVKCRDRYGESSFLSKFFWWYVTV